MQFGVRVLRKWCSFTNSGRFGACFGRLFAKLRHLRDLFRLAHPGFLSVAAVHPVHLAPAPHTPPAHTTRAPAPHASPAPDLDTARGLFYPYPWWRVRAAEGERLESVCWVTPNRGFESRRHRHFSSRPLFQGSAFLIPRRFNRVDGISNTASSGLGASYMPPDHAPSNSAQQQRSNGNGSVTARRRKQQRTR